MQADFIMTSESVTEGHPDKLCDQISDAIVGHFMRQHSLAQVEAECAVSTGILFIAVKYFSTASVDLAAVARDVIRQVGYTADSFDAESCTVLTNLHEYPDQRAPLEDERRLDGAALDSITAKHQTTAFGFACDQTPALMPLPIWTAHRLVRRLDQVRKSGELPFLSPDGKAQVAIEFRERRPHRVHGVTVVAGQREIEPTPAELEEAVRAHVIAPVFEREVVRPDALTRIAVNPEGPLIPGGPPFHAGLTGRKNAVDNYGEFARHSATALSGKDPSRIDRIGPYMARYAAKNVVAAGLAEMCEITLSYSLGLASPVSVNVDTFGTGVIAEDEIRSRLQETIDFRVGGIIKTLRLRDLPRLDDVYRRLAVYGHVGRVDLDLPWERTDLTARIR